MFTSHTALSIRVSVLVNVAYHDVNFGICNINKTNEMTEIK